MCLLVATIATYSMVALAGSERVAGELLVSGKNINGDAPFVKVNGEAAQSGRSIFSSSTIATPENAGAIINLGKIGKVELAPNTTLALSFGENGISGDLLAGRVTVLDAPKAVNIKTSEKTVSLNVGDSATSGQTQNDDDRSSGGIGHGGLIWAVILGGAIVGIIVAARSNNNRVAIGGGTTVISPTR
jgi:hypothetical protein